MPTKVVVVRRVWYNGADCIRHILPVLVEKNAENEAMVAALSFWDPWQYLERDERYTKFQVWLESRGPVPIR